MKPTGHAEDVTAGAHIDPGEEYRGVSIQFMLQGETNGVHGSEDTG